VFGQRCASTAATDIFDFGVQACVFHGKHIDSLARLRLNRSLGMIPWGHPITHRKT
jgi:hypothetical protein